MPALRAPLRVEAGSFDPVFFVVADGATGGQVDLTQPGYEVTAVVSDRPNGKGTVLLELPDSSVWRRTADSRIYFEPASMDSSAWTFRSGFYQAELSHVSGQTVRILEGKFTVDPELVVTP